MYPLDNYYGIRRTYTHGVKTFYNDFHLGIDLIVPIGTPIYAPFDCRVEKKSSKTVGNAAYVYFDGLVARFLHCKEVYDGEHDEGDIIAISGNTGLSTAPHIHLDLSPAPFSLSPKEKFIDPDKFQWSKEETVDTKEERVNARADAMRFAWESWNPGKKVNMDIIYEEARDIEDGKLNQKKLINGWRDTSLKDRNYIKRSEYSNRVMELKKQITTIQKNYAIASKKIEKQEKELTKKAKQLTINDHLRAIGRHVLSWLSKD